MTGALFVFNDDRLPPRFWKKVAVAENGCWNWTAAKDHCGYSVYRHDDQLLHVAHRISYVALVGAVPGGLELDHLCRVRHCVNPAHLEPVTKSINVQRAREFRMKNRCVREADGTAAVARGHVGSNHYSSPAGASHE